MQSSSLCMTRESKCLLLHANILLFLSFRCHLLLFYHTLKSLACSRSFRRRQVCIPCPCRTSSSTWLSTAACRTARAAGWRAPTSCTAARAADTCRCWAIRESWLTARTETCTVRARAPYTGTSTYRWPRVHAFILLSFYIVNIGYRCNKWLITNISLIHKPFTQKCFKIVPKTIVFPIPISQSTDN